MIAMTIEPMTPPNTPVTMRAPSRNWYLSADAAQQGAEEEPA